MIESKEGAHAVHRIPKRFSVVTAPNPKGDDRNSLEVGWCSSVGNLALPLSAPTTSMTGGAVGWHCCTRKTYPTLPSPYPHSFASPLRPSPVLHTILNHASLRSSTPARSEMPTARLAVKKWLITKPKKSRMKLSDFSIWLADFDSHLHKLEVPGQYGGLSAGPPRVSQHTRIVRYEKTAGDARTRRYGRCHCLAWLWTFTSG